MRYWVATPAAAIGAAIFLVFAAPTNVSRVAIADCVKVASLRSAETMSDACMLTADARTGVQSCAKPGMEAEASPSGEAMVWPGDFIAVTADAALAVWQVAMSVVVSIYQIAEAAGEAIV